MMIGTDSHTPMINGIGVLGWGVGGLEAQTVMFGMPTMLRIPDVVGVRLDGALRPGVLATDLALTVTQRLRAIGVAGEFVEFFGPGVVDADAPASAAVVANMAPEYGATTGFFPVDARHARLPARHRPRATAQSSCVEAYMPAHRPVVRPAARAALHADASRSTSRRSACTSPARGGRRTCCGYRRDARRRWPRCDFSAATRHARMPRHPVAIAAITSCTNTSRSRRC